MMRILSVPHSEFVATEGSQPMEGWLAKKLYSNVFFVGGSKWRVLIFLKGNNVDHLLMYLDVAISTTFHFSLAVVNQLCSNFTIWKGIYLASF
ncbi:putative ubiquitinyl hydrolase 1 [Helianthus anomalus]